MRIGDIEVTKSGLTIGGHRYSAGDVVPRSRWTHDVVLAADLKVGPLKGWVRRVRRLASVDNGPAAKAKPVEPPQAAVEPADSQAAPPPVEAPETA